MVDSELGMIPREWSINTLNDITHVYGGSTPSTKVNEFWNGNINWSSPRDLSNLKSPYLLNTDKTITELGLKKISSGLLKRGVLLMSSRAPIGYLALTSIDVAINQGYIGMQAKNGYDNVYLYLWLKHNMNKVIEKANGSTFLEISKTNFRQITHLNPKIAILELFESSIQPIFKKIELLTKETNDLTKMRDLLINKLIK